jgi:hypothetical protein
MAGLGERPRRPVINGGRDFGSILGGWSNSGMGSPTECLTLSSSEWTGLDGLSLNDDGVCSLSDILETGDVPQRYFLSAEPARGSCAAPTSGARICREGGAAFEGPHETANIRAASGGSSRPYVAQTWAVRRLTPRECERLQGFPDDYTLVPGKRGLMADGPRYKMLGNSMACNVMRWIGRRIEAVEAIPSTEMLEAAE